MIKNAAIWGTGATAEAVMKSFPSLEVLYFVDNNAEMLGQKFHGKEIVSPEVLRTENPYIIIASEFHDEISEQLKTLGYQSTVDYCSHIDLIFGQVDNFLISYQKCGRTWLRTILGRILQQQFKFSEEEIMYLTDAPILQKGNLPMLYTYHDDNPHLKAADDLVSDKSLYANKNVVFLVRDPRDVIVSNYYHMKHRAKTYDGDVMTFIEKDIDTIIRYYNIWYEQRDIPNQFIVVKYEDLHVDPLPVLKEIMKVLNIGDIVSDDILREAILYSSFDNMRKYEKENKFKHTSLATETPTENNVKTRKGKKGGYVDELAAEEIEFIDSRIEKDLNPIFNY